MKTALAASVLLLATTVPGVAAAAPAPDDRAGAAAPAALAAVAAEETVTVRGSCVRSGGRVVLRQEVGAEVTTATIRGRGVPNGRWRGEHLVEIGAEEVATEMAVPARGHRFDGSVELDRGGATGGVVDLEHRGGGACSVGYSREEDLVVAADRRLSGSAVVVGPKKQIAQARLRCRAGSRWGLSLTVSTERGSSGAAGSPQRCRDGQLTVRLVTKGRSARLPDVIRVVATRADGHILRLRYAVSGPAAAAPARP